MTKSAHRPSSHMRRNTSMPTLFRRITKSLKERLAAYTFPSEPKNALKVNLASVTSRGQMGSDDVDDANENEMDNRTDNTNEDKKSKKKILCGYPTTWPALRNRYLDYLLP